MGNQVDRPHRPAPCRVASTSGGRPPRRTWPEIAPEPDRRTPPRWSSWRLPSDWQSSADHTHWRKLQCDVCQHDVLTRGV